MKIPWIRTRLLQLASLSALATFLLSGFMLMPASDHRDGPVFGPDGIDSPGGITRSRRDLCDLFVFRSPATPTNTVIIFTVSPFSTVNTPAVFDDNATFDIHITNKNHVNALNDVKLRITFDAPNLNGKQNVVLRGFPAAKFKPNVNVPDPILAKGRTGENIAIGFGINGKFRAAEQDDPAFFDRVGFDRLINPPAANPLPRPVGTALNFFGPNVNALAVSIEIPSQFLTKQGSNVIGVWVTATLNGKQIDRIGRPLINTACIPPIPRGSNNPVNNMISNRRERRSAFNAGHPKDDRVNFKADMVSVLQNFYGRNATDASNIADALLPDIQIFDVTSTEGFGTTIAGMLGNGRRLRDDVVDTMIAILTGGGITTDNVADDNVGSPTNPVNPIQANFPFIGARRAIPDGLPRENVPAPAQ